MTNKVNLFLAKKTKILYDCGLVKVSSNSVGTLINYPKAPISHVKWKMMFGCIIQES